ncbi:MAG: hypothetical protein COA88_07650 [Kordia sp.]|nr:MAG: hypothetical protein COA88_07650 [Kordia sp.]
MKRDYSTFVQLPQKTSQHADSQVSMVKNITRLIGVIKKSIKNYILIVLIEQNVEAVLIKFKYRMFCNHHSIFKQS